MNLLYSIPQIKNQNNVATFDGLSHRALEEPQAPGMQHAMSRIPEEINSRLYKSKTFFF